MFIFILVGDTIPTEYFYNFFAPVFILAIYLIQEFSKDFLKSMHRI